MPVEIRELVIRATAVDSDEERELSEDLSSRSTSSESRDRLVEECVRQVLEILRRREER